MRKFPRTEFSWGEKGLIEAAEGGCDMVLNALMGMRGLAPTYAAIQAGKDIALANKETLVAGGELVMDAAAKAGSSFCRWTVNTAQFFNVWKEIKTDRLRKFF